MKERPDWKPMEGLRVCAATDLDRYPHFVAPKDTIGRVVEGDPFNVRMDTHIDGCEEWENELIYQSVWGDEEQGEPGLFEDWFPLTYAYLSHVPVGERFYWSPLIHGRKSPEPVDEHGNETGDSYAALELEGPVGTVGWHTVSGDHPAGGVRIDGVMGNPWHPPTLVLVNADEAQKWLEQNR